MIDIHPFLEMHDWALFYCPTGVHQLSCLAKEVPDFWSHPPAL